ncbi:MAG: 30S ribosomal protein S12 methylthiotransferase RimO [Clostridiales Family XIII bacterium]|jgi:ribosomal protein S12 methylthiotransferase|nr:30S ribosomal protein S12 methylthiotransferase RimO [Clostridiales Family XIII bacterium]
MSKVFIDTLGCFKNLEDSERAAGLLREQGIEVTDDPAEADALVVNTCGFVEDAKRESISRILELAEYKREDSGKILIVTGCLSQKYSAELAADLPEVDAFLGVNDYDKLAAVISSAWADAGRRIEVSGDIGILTGPRRALAPRYSAFLKIAEGCSNRCTYCAIPSIRGPYRSVPEAQLVREAAVLASEGAKELNLIAQDVSAYGSDRAEGGTLARLLPLLAATRGVEWLRLLYCYEERITDELIDAIARIPAVCAYIDIPLQHIGDGILARMNRRSNRDHIERTLAALRSAVPGIAIRTTFITGFPGETEADFEELYAFAAQQRFERLGVFAYSPEDGTPAAGFPDQVAREVAEERRDALMRLQMDISFEHNRALIGRSLRVLACENEEGNLWSGRTEYDAPEIDNAVMFTAGTAAVQSGDMVSVRITDAMDYDIIGEMEAVMV